MDGVDFRLLDALRKAPTAGHKELAGAIERSPSSVRRRLAALQEAGVLVGFAAIPAAEVLGLEGVAATWATTADTDDLMAAAGTIMAGNNLNGGTLAGGFADSADTWLARATKIVGGAPATRMALDPYHGPIIGPLDLRILRAMVLAPRGSAEELAKACGLSPKTVRQRRARLLADGAVRIHPLIRAGAAPGHVYHLHVTCTAAEANRVIPLLGEASVAPGNDPILCAFVRAENQAGQARTLAAVRALSVANVEVVQENQWDINTAELLRLVDAALAKW